MKNIFFILFCAINMILFGQKTNIDELTNSQKDIVVKIKEKIGGKKEVRINTDEKRDELEQRVYFDNRLKEDDSRKIIYFDNEKEIHAFLERHGYKLNPNKVVYWDHPDGTKNVHPTRNGTAKIMNLSDIGDMEVPEKPLFRKKILVFSTGKIETPKKKAKACCPSKCNKVLYFDINKTDVNEKELASIASKMKKDKKYTIVGFADLSGDAKYNEKLAMNRANAVKNLLIEKHDMKVDLLTTKSMGEEKAKGTNAKERRVEIQCASACTTKLF